MLDFECLPMNKVHSSFHITEDETGEKLTDVLEIHYLELPKLFKANIKTDENEEIIQWMMFLEANNREGLEMLAEKNEKIKKACSILEVISKDDIKRAAYEAREAELHDQATRLQSAKEDGIKQGIEKGIKQGIEKGIKQGMEQGRKEALTESAKNLLLIGADVEFVSKGIGLTIEEVEEIKKSLN
ncbi:PD-(D/E)XK nuclease family transposase [Clostridium sp. SHJSY1]|uniref:PD-(D/E)XK nuclease family transposase n=1 Tax=Clostridium sp. SHJSY1 TaxID=2942483 RepID=UPI00287BB129|nr:PD-(D/E)XK nuclease family transposase [Clostridium sp. SHJSY1]